MIPPDDDALWQTYAQGVRRLGEKEEEPVLPAAKKPRSKPLVKEDAAPLFAEALAREKPAPQKEEVPVLSSPPVQAAAPSPPLAIARKEPLDLRVERNMSLGDVVIEGRLDLHGKTEQEAYDSFSSFIETQHARGKRMLLIVTGKGQDGQSVLRFNLPRWCDVPPFAERVMAVRTAALHHGGDGAYYVLLRKR